MFDHSIIIDGFLNIITKQEYFMKSLFVYMLRFPSNRCTLV
jgi:hypothetical protein